MLRDYISAALGSDVIDMSPVSGGDINASYLASIRDGKFFVKFNDSPGHQAILRSEAKALQLFNNQGISCPGLIKLYEQEDYTLLILDYIPNSKGWTARSIEGFVDLLTKLHSITHDQYGLDEDNCIGSLPQANKWYDDFADYYWDSRLQPQLEMAYNKQLLPSPDGYAYMYERCKEVPSEMPCLIHGDLWSGNYLIDQNENSYLIDPSISYGHREMDLAMMRLFGGYPESIFDAYNEIAALKEGWHDRVKLFQLYYLLAHLNLFGISYRGQVVSILDRYK